MDLKAIAQDMNDVSEKLVSGGLVHLLGGNFSARTGNRMAITGHASAKHRLTADDLFEVGVDSDENPSGISSTLGIHRAILRRTNAGAIVHAHPYYATLLSYYTDHWSPIDENGIYYLGEAVHAVASEGYMKWALLEDELAELLTHSTAAVLKWHGTFTIGKSLTEALNATQAVELSARLIIDTHQLRSELGDARLPNYANATRLTDADPQTDRRQNCS